MRPGNQWNWTWAFLAIIIGFQCASLFCISGSGPDFLLFLSLTAVLPHGLSLVTGVLFRLAKRPSALTGYWNALPLSITGVPANIIVVGLAEEFVLHRHSPLIFALGCLVFPGILMTIAFRDLTKKESQQATPTLPRVPLGG